MYTEITVAHAVHLPGRERPLLVWSNATLDLATSRREARYSFAFQRNPSWDSRALLLAKEGLDLGIQRLPLGCLAVHSAEALDAEFLARLLHNLEVLLETGRHPLLGACRAGLAHDPAVRVLHQRVLGQATSSLLLLAAEDRRVA